MSTQTSTDTGSWKTWLVALTIGIIVVFTAGVVLVAAIGGAIGGAGDADDSAVCTPGDGEDAKVEIPEEYSEFVDNAAAEAGLSASVIGAQLHAESGWDPKAESAVGAQGIAQFMPATWEQFGEGGDPFDPKDAIAAQGRYLKYLADFMKEGAGGDDELLVRLVMAGYNAGEGAVKKYDFDLDEMFSDPNKPGYKNETKAYVEKIVKAAKGDYGSDCKGGGGGDVPKGGVVDTAAYLAWEERVEMPRSTAYGYGEDKAKPEYVDAANKLSKDHHTAYYTDCGVFVATVMISSGTDKSFPKRGTSGMYSYMQNSDKYKFFTPSSEADLKPGDILVKHGHIYLYTGERNSSPTGRAQGASLYTRPPSGHNMLLGGEYKVGRYEG